MVSNSTFQLACLRRVHLLDSFVLSAKIVLQISMKLKMNVAVLFKPRNEMGTRGLSKPPLFFFIWIYKRQLLQFGPSSLRRPIKMSKLMNDLIAQCVVERMRQGA